MMPHRLAAAPQPPRGRSSTPSAAHLLLSPTPPQPVPVPGRPAAQRLVCLREGSLHVPGREVPGREVPGGRVCGFERRGRVAFHSLHPPVLAAQRAVASSRPICQLKLLPAAALCFSLCELRVISYL